MRHPRINEYFSKLDNKDVHGLQCFRQNPRPFAKASFKALNLRYSLRKITTSRFPRFDGIKNTRVVPGILFGDFASCGNTCFGHNSFLLYYFNFARMCSDLLSHPRVHIPA